MNKHSVLELLQNAADRFSHRVAVEQSGRRLYYSELEQRSNRLANDLLASGTGKGSIVAVLVEDACELIISIVGILKSGAVFAPLDPHYPQARLKAMIAEINPRVCIAEGRFAEKLNEISPRSFEGFRVIPVGADFPSRESAAGERFEAIKSACDDRRPTVQLEPDDMCYLYFTSGSTGRPKAIAGSVKGLSHFIRWEVKTFGINEEYRFSQLHSPSFDPFLRDVLVPLCSGATVCIPESRDVIVDAARLIEWIESSRVNLIHIIPTLFRAIINEEPDANYFRELKCVLLAGEQVFPAEVKQWFRIYNHVRLVNLYGPTETTLAKFFYFIKPSDVDRKLIPVGKPMEGAKALILNDSRKICPTGVVGEICIRTPFRSLGYYGQPEATKEVFIQNPFGDDPNDLIYKTGDMGRVLEDGNFELLGRTDQQIKVRGVRLELGEIEGLLKAHEAIKDAAVKDWEDANREKFLCAYVVSDAEVDSNALRSYLSNHLPENAVPTFILWMAELPRNLNGKIDRKGLPHPKALINATEDYVEPRSDTEKRLASIWQAVLQLERIGVKQNFFASGGHSLKATQVLSRINKKFEVELALRALFELPTIGDLAPVIDQLVANKAQDLKAPAIVPVERGDRLPLSFAQQRLWFLDQFEPGSPAYLQSVAVRLTGELDSEALERSLSEIVARHEVLRTSFPIVDGQPAQVICPPRPLALPLVDLSHWPSSERPVEAARLVNEEARHPMNLALGPLLRAGLLRLGREDHILLLTMHHIVCDGWSTRILVREMSQLYSAFRSAGASPLPDLPIQYADFAYWQRQWLQSGVQQAQLDYWKQHLQGDLPVVELPTDYARPALRSFNGATESIVLSQPLSHEIKELGRRAGATLFITLMAAFKALLYKYTGMQDMIIGTPIANRNHVEVEELIGFFVNTLVFRTELSGNPTFRQLLERVRRVALEAYAHQDVPFEKLVEELQPQREPGHTPIFQIVFALQEAADEKLQLPGLNLSSFKIERVTSKFDLIFYVIDTDKGLIISLEYSTDLFEAATIKRMAAHFERLVESIVAAPHARLDELEVLSESEALLLESAVEVGDFDSSFSF